MAQAEWRLETHLAWLDFSPTSAAAAAGGEDHEDAPGALPLVFLHNGFDAARTWSDVAYELTRSEAHPRLVAWDRYGAGEGAGPADPPLRVPDDLLAHGCEELRQRLDRLGLERCILVGHCLGGAVAARFAALHGDRCAGLHLTATGLFSTEALRERVDWLLVPWSELPDEAREHLQAMHGVGYAERLWELIVAHRAGYIRDPAYDLRPLLARIRCPVRYLLGSRDVYFDRQYAEAGLRALGPAARSASSLTIWSGAGHDLHRERPAAFADDLREFTAHVLATRRNPQPRQDEPNSA